MIVFLDDLDFSFNTKTSLLKYMHRSKLYLAFANTVSREQTTKVKYAVKRMKLANKNNLESKKDD